jgi:CheY-like chemotaxis protein
VILAGAPEDSQATAYLIKKAFPDRGEKIDCDLCFAKDGEEAMDCLSAEGDEDLEDPSCTNFFGITNGRRYT